MTTTADTTETATIGHALRPLPAADQPPPRSPTQAPATSPDEDPVAALHRWAHTLGHIALPAADYAELVAAGQEAAAFLQAANAEVRRLRQALEEIAQRAHGVRSFEQSARLAGIHEYATTVLDPTIERLIDGNAR